MAYPKMGEIFLLQANLKARLLKDRHEFEYQYKVSVILPAKEFRMR